MERADNFTPDQARRFVLENRYALGNDSPVSRCVDGRYTHEESQAAARAIPGGDAGYVLGVLAMARSLERQGHAIDLDQIAELIDTTIEIIGSGNFRWHSAEGHGLDGCGHLGKARDLSELYGVKDTDVQLLEGILHQLEEDTEGRGKIILRGPHKEQAVIIVDSAQFGLHAQDESSQAFIYHRTLDGKFQKELIEKLRSTAAFSHLEIESNEMEKVFAEVMTSQLTETVKRLAAGRPQFLARIGPDGAELEELGLVAA